MRRRGAELDSHARAARRDDRSTRSKSVFLVDSLDALSTSSTWLHSITCSRVGRRSRLRRLLHDRLRHRQGSFRDAVALALALRIYSPSAAASFPKTSGQTGLHVLCRLAGDSVHGHQSASELFGRLLELVTDDFDHRASVDAPGRVFIDTGQTGRARAIVAPYRARGARPRCPRRSSGMKSMPLDRAASTSRACRSVWSKWAIRSSRCSANAPTSAQRSKARATRERLEQTALHVVQVGLHRAFHCRRTVVPALRESRSAAAWCGSRA